MKQNCKRCLFEWDSIVALPRVCPRCKSYYWTKSRLLQGVNSPEATVAMQPMPLVQENEM